MMYLSVKQMEKITNEADYKYLMAKIDSLMVKGSDNVSKEELTEIRSLALIVQNYEQAKYAIDTTKLSNY